MTAIAFCRKPIRALLSFRNRVLGAGDERLRRGKIKRTGVRKLADLQRSRNLCLHIGF